MSGTISSGGPHAIIAAGTVASSILKHPARVALEVRRHGRYHRIRSTLVYRGKRSFRLIYYVKQQGWSIAFARIRVTRGHRTLFLSAVVAVSRHPKSGGSTPPGTIRPVASPGSPGTSTPSPGQPGSSPPGSSSVTYKVPATTRLYPGGTVASAVPAGPDNQVLVTLAPGAPTPVVGGHAALAPAAGLPYGMFGQVLAVQNQPGGTTALLVTAPIDQVLDDVQYSFNQAVTPILVDVNGTPIAGSESASGALVLRGSIQRAAAPGGAFDCKTTSGTSVDQTKVWGTDLNLPISIKLENTAVLHQFDTGNALLGRAPFLALQFSGQAVASIGFDAKVGFKCSLSTSFRENHRLMLPLKNIGPVPVVAYFEPSLDFSVSATGSVHLSQRHYFSFTLTKSGDDPLSFKRGSSADPPQFTGSARLNASLFAGGDLSLLIGAGGKSADIGAGLYGSFGPKFSLSTDSTKPGCMNANVALQADLGIRLDVWTKRWNLAHATLTSPTLNLPGSPFCGLPDPVTTPTDGGGTAALPPLSQLAGGPYDLCGLRRDNSNAMCWGVMPKIDAPLAGAFVQLAVGSGHACGIRPNHTVACWGDNSSGEATPPTGTFSQIAAGAGANCGIRTDKTIACWGQNTFGELNAPTGQFKQVDIDFQACGVRIDGTVACWGYNDSGEATPPTGTFTQVAVSRLHSCGVRTDGTIACWGDASYAAGIPTGQFSEVSAGEHDTCALKKGAGIPVCWSPDYAGTQARPSDESFTHLISGFDWEAGIHSDGSLVLAADAPQPPTE